MIIRVEEAQARAILGSMLQIALTHGSEGVGDYDRNTMYGAAHIVLGLANGVPDDLVPCSPEALAQTMAGDVPGGVQAVRMAAVMSLVDGRLDEEKLALVQEFADALDVHGAYLRVLAEAAAGEVAAAACMMRKNAETFPGLDLHGPNDDRIAPFLPYRDGGADPDLVARYEALGDLPPETFRLELWDHFKRNRFACPGDPNGLAEAFTAHHDTSHVLSGYSTSPAGELLVSTFIGAMHRDHPMAAEVLPALFSYHLGIGMNKIASVRSLAFEPESFWTAWERGDATTTTS